MKFKIESFDGGFSIEIEFSGETPRRAYKACTWYATLPGALKFIQDEYNFQGKALVKQEAMQTVHEQMMELYQQYDAGIILVTEFVAKVREIEKLIPANVQGLIDPSTGLRYP